MAEGDPSDTPEVSLLDVILDGSQVERARETVEHAADGLSLRRQWGAEPVQERGSALLISGPAGSGKSTLALALASHMKVPVAEATGTSLSADAELLSDFLSKARADGALGVIHGCEALFSSDRAGRQETLRALDLHGELVVLVTERPADLDPRLVGSAIEHIRCRYPDAEQRQAIWELHLPPDVPLEDDVDVRALGGRFPMSGREISDAVRRAVHLAVARQPSAPRIGQGLLMEICEAWGRRVYPDSLMEPGEPNELSRVLARRERVEDEAGLGPGLVGRRAFLVLVDGPDSPRVARRLIAASGHRHLCLNPASDAASMDRQLDQAMGRRAVVLVEDAELLFPTQDPALDNEVSRAERRRGLELLASLDSRDLTALFTTYAFGAVGDRLTRKIAWRHGIDEPGPEDRSAAWGALWPQESPPLAPEDLKNLAARWELSEEQISHVIRRASFEADGGDLSVDLVQRACEQEYRTAGKVTRLTPQESPTDPPTT